MHTFSFQPQTQLRQQMMLRMQNITPLRRRGGAGISTTRSTGAIRDQLLDTHQRAPMNDKCKRPPLAHASGMPVTDNFNVSSAGPRLAIFSQDQSAGNVQ
jgi:hypothetical protein